MCHICQVQDLKKKKASKVLLQFSNLPSYVRTYIDAEINTFEINPESSPMTLIDKVENCHKYNSFYQRMM